MGLLDIVFVLVIAILVVILVRTAITDPKLQQILTILVIIGALIYCAANIWGPGPHWGPYYRR